MRLLLLALYWLETECVRHLYKPPVFHYPEWVVNLLGIPPSLFTSKISILPIRSDAKAIFFSVRAPDEFGVVGRVGCNLTGPAACRGYCVDVTFIGECDGGSIRRNGTITHP